MDVSLLNFWIEKIDFYIQNDVLYITLYVPMFKTYYLQLTNDKNKILDFFGFDISIEYDKLSERNLFEYLCTSKNLSHNDITLLTIKDFIPSKLHRKFNEYLKNKYHINDTLYINFESTEKDWKQYAIKYFNKDKEYECYKSQYELFAKCKSCFKKLHLNESDKPKFFSFMMVYGIKNIIDVTDLELKSKWDVFDLMNWSSLEELYH